MISPCYKAVLEMAGRQVAKCDQKSFWATSFGQKYVYLSPEDLSLGDQLRIYAYTPITELCQCKLVVRVCNSFYDLAIVGAVKLYKWDIYTINRSR